MSRVIILSLRRELRKFEIYHYIEDVQAIFVERALGKYSESGEKRNTLQRKESSDLLLKPYLVRWQNGENKKIKGIFT